MKKTETVGGRQWERREQLQLAVIETSRQPVVWAAAIEELLLRATLEPITKRLIKQQIDHFELQQ